MLFTTIDAPPEDGAQRVRFKQLRSPVRALALLAGKTGRLQLASWLPTSAAADHADALVLGDSYCDDVDMGYRCWPTALASLRGWSMLSAAQGGSKAGHWTEQLERAHAYSAELGVSISANTVCVVHLGGNDILHSLWLGPIAVALLLVDLACIAA
eukprot:1818006-Prymnesium_polylepis.1